jgi:hypothetical protein
VGVAEAQTIDALAEEIAGRMRKPDDAGAL